MSDTMKTPGNAQAIIDTVKALHGGQLITLPNDEKALLAASGMRLNSIKELMDEYRVRPDRREGTATLLSLQSFIDWTTRHSDSNSVIFADNNPSAPSLTSVIDYHESGEDGLMPEDSLARNCRHRGVYKFPLSKAWQVWAGVDGSSMTQAKFAAFLEDRIGDVLVPPKDGAKEEDAKLLDLISLFGGTAVGPTRLLELSRGLQVHETSRVKNVVNLSTGEMQVVFETEHRDAAGEPLKVPNVFIIGIPVFEMGAAYRIPVRLRYRRVDGGLSWSLSRYRPELFFDAAFSEAVEAAKAGTGLTTFLGRPE